MVLYGIKKPVMKKLPGIVNSTMNNREASKLLNKNVLRLSSLQLSPHHIIEAHIMPAIGRVLPNTILSRIVTVCRIKKFRLREILLIVLPL